MSDLLQTSGEPPEEQVEAVPPVSTAPPVVEVVPTPEAAPVSPVAHDERIYRHALLVRIGHWINVLCVPILIMSGLQIFNAHPALYWGDRSDRDRPLLAMRAVVTESGERKGVTTVLGHPFDTAGVRGSLSAMYTVVCSWATLARPR